MRLSVHQVRSSVHLLEFLFVLAIYSAYFNLFAMLVADNRARFPTDKAVEASVAKFYTERDKSWVKRSAKQHGLGRHSTAQLISTQHKMAFEALTWDSGLCLGVPIPSRRPQPSKSAWLLSV